MNDPYGGPPMNDPYNKPYQPGPGYNNYGQAGGGGYNNNQGNGAAEGCCACLAALCCCCCLMEALWHDHQSKILGLFLKFQIKIGNTILFSILQIQLKT